MMRFFPLTIAGGETRFHPELMPERVTRPADLERRPSLVRATGSVAERLLPAAVIACRRPTRHASQHIKVSSRNRARTTFFQKASCGFLMGAGIGTDVYFVNSDETVRRRDSEIYDRNLPLFI